jgi:hypothetical protein
MLSTCLVLLLEMYADAQCFSIVQIINHSDTPAPPRRESSATMVAAVSLPSQAQAVLRSRLCDPVFIHSALSSSLDTNYR